MVSNQCKMKEIQILARRRDFHIVRKKWCHVVPVSSCEDPASVDDVAPTVPPVLILDVARFSRQTNFSTFFFLTDQGQERELSFFCRNASNDLKKTREMFS